MDAQETSLYTAILIASIIIGVIIIYFVVSIISQQRKNLELHKRNVLTEITALEKERSRIATDLHDELGPLLSAVKMKINSFELVDEDDKAEVVKTNQHIDQMVSRVREISFDLMPSALLRKGLIVAIREFADYIMKSNALDISVNAQESLMLSEQKAVNIYRIMQEVIHNTLKHAKASKLAIEVRADKTNVIIKTTDNGVGFNAGELTKNTGLGLRSLLSRTEIMNGAMFLDSQPGQGTSFTFEIPLT
jgi:two-component system NarL family sensor kinase